MKFTIKRLLYFTAAIGLLLAWLVRPEMESRRIANLFKNGQRSLLSIEVEMLEESLQLFTDAEIKSSRMEYSAWTLEQLICGGRTITVFIPTDVVGRRGSFQTELQIELQIGVFRNRVLSVYEPLSHPPFDPDVF